MDFVHVGLLNISPVDIRRLAFYLVIRIYSSVTNAITFDHKADRPFGESEHIEGQKLLDSSI